MKSSKWPFQKTTFLSGLLQSQKLALFCGLVLFWEHPGLPHAYTEGLAGSEAANTSARIRSGAGIGDNRNDFKSDTTYKGGAEVDGEQHSGLQRKQEEKAGDRRK